MMMNTASFTLTVILPRRKYSSVGASVLGAMALTAGLHDAAAQGAAVPAKVAGKEYVLTKSSSFDAPPANSRNPFWPIGWVPGPAVAQVQAQVYDVKVEDFVLSTTSVDFPPLAIINGKSYGVGESVPVSATNPEIVKVKRILDGVVLLDHQGRELRIVAGTATARAKK